MPLHSWDSDTFTDADNTLLSDHDTDTGKTWSRITLSQPTAKIVSGNITGGGARLSQDPPSLNVLLKCVVTRISVHGSAGGTLYAHLASTPNVSYVAHGAIAGGLGLSIARASIITGEAWSVSAFYPAQNVSRDPVPEPPESFVLTFAVKGNQLTARFGPLNITVFDPVSTLLGGSHIGIAVTDHWVDDWQAFYSDEPFFDDFWDNTNEYLTTIGGGGTWNGITYPDTSGIINPGQGVGTIANPFNPLPSASPTIILTTNPSIPDKPEWTGTLVFCKDLDDPLTSPDYSVEGIFNMNTLSDPLAQVGVAGRIDDDSGNHYYLVLTPTGLELGRVISNVVQPLATYSFTVVAGQWYELRLYMQGENLKGYLDEELVIDGITDGNLTDIGCPGLRFRRGSTGTDLRVGSFRVYENQQETLITENLHGVDKLEIRKETFDLNIRKPDRVNAVERLEITRDLGAGDMSISIHDEMKGYEGDIVVPEIETPPSLTEIVIQDAFGGLDSSLRSIPKFVSILETFFALDNASRTFRIADKFKGLDSIALDRLVTIIDQATMTDVVRLYVLIQMADQITIEEAIQTIRTVKETFTFQDLIDLFEDRAKTDQMQARETIMIKRSFDEPPDFTEPDDVTEVVKDKFAEIINPRKIK